MSNHSDDSFDKGNSSAPSELALQAFLHELRSGLRPMKDDRKALRFSLRLTGEHFKIRDGCLAVLAPGGAQADPISVMPRGSLWDLDLLTTFLRGHKVNVPRNIIVAPIHRRGRPWAVLCLKSPHEIPRHAARLLSRVTRIISEAVSDMDWQRIVEVRSRIDRKIVEQLRPQDLFYQILHGLRSLMQYDHSSALLICDRRENALDLVAEQIAWVKGKSRRIGLRLPLTDDLWKLMLAPAVYAFDRRDGHWRQWLGQESAALAELLDYNSPAGADSELRESAILCAPLATREGLLGVLKVAALQPGSFGAHEVDLLQRFVPLSAVTIQNSQRAVNLETKMLEAEKKHAIANLARGVSHDVNNALGSMLPLVQQVMADALANRIEPGLLLQDLQQIEQSIQTCRRIFGGMLALARGAGQGTAQANVRRALDNTIAILHDGFERQGIRLDVRLLDAVPAVRAGQGDVEQLFLNLATNAKDAMPAGGVLTIRSERMGDKLEITIRDTGSGIAPEHMSSIQQPFFTTKHNGNGLGLSICRSIIWNLNGEMKIDSKVGAGTEVRLVLPVVQETPDN